MAQQDYCEIILNAVSQIVTAETAARQNKGMIACRVKDITERNLGRYSVNYKGDTFLACGEATDYEIDDEVYVLRAENTGSQLSVIVGRKLREDEFPIQINDPLTKMMRLKEWRPTSASGAYEVTPSAPYDTIGLSFDAIGEFTITLKVVNTVGRTYTYELDETNFLFSSDFGIALTQRCTIDISRTGTPLRVELSTTGDLTNFIVDFGYNITNKLESDKALKLYTEGEQKYYTDSFGNLKENNTVNLYLDWLYLDENAEIKSLTHINYLENKPLGFDVNWYKQTEGADGDFYSGPGWTKIEPVSKISDAETEVLAKNNNLFALTGGEKALFSGDLVQTAIKAVVIYTPVGATAVEAIVSNELVFENIQDEPLEYITRGSIELSDGSNAVYPLWALNGFLKDQNDVYKEREFNFSYSTGLGVEALYKNIASVTWYIPKANMYYFSKERTSSTAIQSLEGEYAVLTIIPFEVPAAKDNQGNNLTGDNLYKGALKEVFRADYKLMERYIANRISNKVICEINFKDETETWKQERDLYFSKAGLDGTGSQILIWLTDSETGNLARTVQLEKQYYVNTLFVDENGEEQPTHAPTSIELINGVNKIEKIDDKWQLTVTNNIISTDWFDVIKVKYHIEDQEIKPINNIIYRYDETKESIIAVTEEVDKIIKPPMDYVEYYPISFANSIDYGYSGPTYITYDSSGRNPVYDDIVLTLWDKNKKYETQSNYVLVWDLNYQVDGNYTQALPKIKTYSGVDKVYPADYYENNIEYICNITASRLNINTAAQQILFVQPLVIRQARHFSTILDNWDGNLKIDADGNYVLSSALVGGNKNSDGTFNGVIVGTLNTIVNEEVPIEVPYLADADGKPVTDLEGNKIEEKSIVYKENSYYNPSLTGILGYKNGAQTYGFFDNGSAFIGPSGKGQIRFDGTNGTIKSGGDFKKARRDSKTGVITQDGEGEGFLIDFVNGGLYAPNFILDPNGDASFAGRISAAWGTVGGYIIASRMLYATAGENKYMALLSPKYVSATHEDINDYNTNIISKEYVQEKGLENWYYDKNGEGVNDPATWHKYADIPLIENQAGPGLIIENNKRRLRALFNKTNKQPQYMVDWYKVEEDKTEKNLGSVAIGWEQTTEIDSYYPGLFGEGALGDSYKLGVTGEEVAKIKFATGQQQEETITGTFLYMKNMKPVYVANSSPPKIDKYVVGSETLIGNNKVLFSSDKQISSFGINSFWSGNAAFATSIPTVEGTDGSWMNALGNLGINLAGIHITKDEFTSIQVGADTSTYAMWRIGTGANGVRAMRNDKENGVTGSFEVSLPLGTQSGHLKWTPGNKVGEFVLKSNGTTQSELVFKGNTATICGLNIEEKIDTEVAATTYNILQSRKIDSSASEIIFGGDGTSSDNSHIDKGNVSSGRTVYIGTTNINSGTTDKIIFKVPVEFANADINNVAPIFTNTEGVIFKTENKWMQIKGDMLTGGATQDKKSFELYSGGNGLIFYYQPLSVNATTTENATYVNKKGIAINIGTGENKDTYYMVARNDMNGGIQALYKSAFINLYNTTLSFFTNNDDTATNFVLKSDGTGSLKLATLTLKDIQLTQVDDTGFNWKNAKALKISDSLQVTNYIGANEVWAASDFRINGISISEIYLKKNLLRLDNNYKNIIGFDQVYYVNGGDNGGTYTNYYTFKEYGVASKVTINADNLTYYYLGDYNKDDKVITVKATNISYYKERLEYSGQESKTQQISGTTSTEITAYKQTTCGNKVTCYGTCTCGETVECTGFCDDWWYWTDGTTTLDNIPWQAQVKAIADSSFAIGDTDISTTIQIEQL